MFNILYSKMSNIGWEGGEVKNKNKFGICVGIFALLFFVSLVNATELEIFYDGNNFTNGMIVNSRYDVRVEFDDPDAIGGALSKVKIYWWNDTFYSGKFKLRVIDKNSNYSIETDSIQNMLGKWQTIDTSNLNFIVNGPFYIEIHNCEGRVAVGMDESDDSGHSFHYGFNTTWVPVSDIGWPCDLGIRAFVKLSDEAAETTTATVVERDGGGGNTRATNIGKPKPSCFDGIQNCHDNACEEGIDCGGPCQPCPSCFDGIQNQGEEGVDCGGPCEPCVTTTTSTTTVLTTTSIRTTLETSSTLTGGETTTLEETTIVETPLVGRAIGTTVQNNLITLLIIFISLIAFIIFRRRRKNEK